MENSLQSRVGCECGYCSVQTAWILWKIESYVGIQQLPYLLLTARHTFLSAIALADGTYNAANQPLTSEKNFSCSGNEQHLNDCNFTSSMQYCTNNDDKPAVVYCFGNGKCLT